MDRKTNLENQRRFVAEKKAQGLKRLVLWVQPEGVEGIVKQEASALQGEVGHLDWWCVMEAQPMDHDFACGRVGATQAP